MRIVVRVAATTPMLIRALTLGLLALVPGGVQAQVKVDKRLPSYRRTSAVSGTIKMAGSDTMNSMVTLWTEGFLRAYPNVEAEIEAKGSATAPPALAEGLAIFGVMTRQLMAREQDRFQRAFGYPCTRLATSIDMLAIYVHKDNPIVERGLTLAELDAVLSSTRRRGHDEIRTWGDLGLEGDWAERPISVYGRNAASGTYGFVKTRVLRGGDYKVSVKQQPASASVVQGVATDRFGLGYSGIGFLNADVRAVPVGETLDAKIAPVAPRVADYPLSRSLYLIVNHRPNSRLEPLRAEFIRYVFSREGQFAVVKDGYLPVNFARAQREMAKVGLDLAPAVDRRRQ